MTELEERLAGVYDARYQRDLDALVADLPRTAEPRSATGWRMVLALVLAQLRSDLALVFGRGVSGWKRRRVVGTVFVALVAVGLVVAVLHGLGDGVHNHGVDGDGVAGAHRHG